MLRFLDGLLMGTTSSAGVAAEAGAGGGGNEAAAAAAAAATATNGDKGKGGEGAFAFPTEKAFAEYLPEKFKALPNFRDIKSFDGLLDTFVNQQKLVGLDKAKLAVLPKDDNDNDALSNIYKALGRPEKVDGYQIPKAAEGKEYSAGDLAFQKTILPILHEAGVTQRQLAAIVPKWNEIQAAVGAAEAEKSKTAMAEANKALRTEFGAAYDTKVKTANDALAWFANDGPKLGADLEAWLKSTGPDGQTIGNNPVVAKLFSYLGEQMKEDGLIGKSAGGAQGEVKSPAEAKQEIAALQQDEKFKKAWLDKRTPGHAEAVAQMQRLREMAFPPEKPAA